MSELMEFRFPPILVFVASLVAPSMSTAQAEKWFDGSRYVRAARPDGQGQYAIKGLPPADYLAIAIDYVQDGMWNDPEYLESIRRYGQKLTLGEGESCGIALKLVTGQNR